MNYKGVVAIIPARGGSKRLPRKNVAPFFGRPLIQYAIEACKSSRYINRGVYVSTEDREIASIASRLGARIIDRPPHLSKDDVWTQDVLEHAARFLHGIGVDFDIIARIHASPQVRSFDIDQAIEKMIDRDVWEVFSVNKEDIEDAVIHILRDTCVSQRALSVYKAVIHTNYNDIHCQEDLDRFEDDRIREIEKSSLKFFSSELHRLNHASLRSEIAYILGRRKLLWTWQMTIPLADRWKRIVKSSTGLRSIIYAVDGWERARNMSVLDLGCGFGMYWPVMHEYGFMRFVGIDLFDMRREESYYETAKKYIRQFCFDCDTQLIMDDARNLHRYVGNPEKFDVFLNIATVSTKLRSTAIPYSLFQDIVRKYGKDDCIGIHIENINQ